MSTGVEAEAWYDVGGSVRVCYESWRMSWLILLIFMRILMTNRNEMYYTSIFCTHFVGI
jgi:hypothetical protein